MTHRRKFLLTNDRLENYFRSFASRQPALEEAIRLLVEKEDEHLRFLPCDREAYRIVYDARHYLMDVLEGVC